MRDDNARLERRLGRLEAGLAVTAPSASAPSIGGPASKTGEIPSLTVVKLKPKVEPAPKVDTSVAIVEPSPDALDELVATRGDYRETEQKQDPVMGDTMFESALVSLKTGNIPGGVDALQRFVEEFPKHAKADNALYYTGVGLMGLSNYEGAAETFERLLTAYPAAEVLSDAMLKLGECRVRLNKPDAARDVYRDLVNHFPDTQVARQAEQRLAALPGSTNAGRP